jgi:hypothetical protein
MAALNLLTQNINLHQADIELINCSSGCVPVSRDI